LGAFSTITGDSLQLILTGCNADNFQIFLDSLLNQDPKEFKIMVLDNGTSHKAKKLRVPENIALVFLPPFKSKTKPCRENVGQV
jgi:hypothetical protein